MIRRTTIELDDELVDAARRALGQPTVRATVETALRQAIAAQTAQDRTRRAVQIEALLAVGDLVDKEVLLSEEAWR